MTLIRDDLLAMLRCPEQRSTLSNADDSLVARVNDAIRAGRLHNRGGQRLERMLDGALLRQDGAVAYPILDGIPVLLIDEGIPLDQLAS